MRKLRALPSREKLREMFRYDGDRGLLIWASPPLSSPVGKVVRKMSHTRLIGRPALNTDDGNGYLYGQINGQRYRAHRVIWKYHFGSEPELIDHIDGNPKNNRIENLRSADHSLNACNRVRRRSNTSGHTGVSAVGKKWKATYRLRGTDHYLGVFDTKAEAVSARAEALSQVSDFTDRHGLPRKRKLS